VASTRNAFRMDHPVVIAFLVIAVIATMSLAQEVLKPFALSILLCLTLAPFSRVFEKWGLPRGGAVILTVLLAMGTLGGVGFVLSRQLLSLANELPGYENEIIAKVESLRPKSDTAVDRVQKVIDDVSQKLDEPPPEEERSVIDVRVVSQPTFTDRLRSAIGPLLEPLALGSLVLVLVLFMLWDREDMIDRLIRLLGHGRISLTMKTLEEAGARIGRYLAMLTAVNSSFGMIIGLGLWALGVPYAVLWGTMAAVLRFIPYLGPMVAFVLPLCFSVASSPAGSWTEPLGVLALFGVIEIAANSYLEPLIYGKTTEVSPLSLLVAAMFWTWLWGVLGLLLSTPLTVCLAVLGKYVPSLGFLATLLGEEPPLAQDVKFYQRLLALDEDAANEILETALKQSSRVEVFDSILIPALRRTKRDLARDELGDEEREFIARVVNGSLDDLEETPDPTAGPADVESIASSRALRIVGISADDMADALVLKMLALVLPSDECNLEIVNDTSSPLQLSEVVTKYDPDLIVLSHLPPGGLTATRYLIKRLRTRLSDPPIVVGLWGIDGDITSATDKLKASGASRVVSSLAAVRERILATIHVAAEVPKTSEPPLRPRSMAQAQPG
jgi:predicted PurR-regulated permease PerM